MKRVTCGTTVSAELTLLVTNTHHVILKQFFLMFNVLEERLKHVSRIGHAYRRRAVIHDRDVLQATLPDRRPYIT